jgi:hypothetical protein
MHPAMQLLEDFGFVEDRQHDADDGVFQSGTSHGDSRLWTVGRLARATRTKRIARAADACAAWPAD